MTIPGEPRHRVNLRFTDVHHTTPEQHRRYRMEAAQERIARATERTARATERIANAAQAAGAPE